ncbi:MAG: hypothetical protein HFJ84_01065 [Clostridiales bacterium]|jgi:hypothetical protein|nr:hypothetical protein [Clostridiales bacterium]
MKKIFALLLCGLLSGTVLFGCQAEPNAQLQSSSIEPIDDRLIQSNRSSSDQLKSVTVQTQFEKYPVEDIKEIRFSIEEQNQDGWMYSEIIHLEIEQNGAWYQIPPNQGASGKLRDSLNPSIDFIQWSKFDFPTGHYRVVWTPNKDEKWAAGEFWLVPKEEAVGISNDDTVKIHRNPDNWIGNFSLDLEKDAYPAGIRLIPMLVSNNTSEQSSFADNTLELDVRKEDGWYNIPRDLLAEYAGIFSAGKQHRHLLSLENWYPESLYPGRYRVVHQERGKWTSAEFDLVPDPSPTWKLADQSQQSRMLYIGIFQSGNDAMSLTLLDERGSPFLTAIDQVDLQIQVGKTWKSVPGDVSVSRSLFDLPQLPYEGNTYVLSFVSGDPERGNLHLGFQPDFWPGSPLEPGHYRLIFASGKTWVGAEFFVEE